MIQPSQWTLLNGIRVRMKSKARWTSEISINSDETLPPLTALIHNWDVEKMGSFLQPHCSTQSPNQVDAFMHFDALVTMLNRAWVRFAAT